MFLRNIWHTFRALVRNSLEFLWFSYSTPTPRNAGEIFTLLFSCLAISMITGALLFHWLNKLLMYTPQTAGIAAAIYAVGIFIFSFLIHPLRCAFTLMFPTLGTRQGRKLILSMCAMIVVLNILPNITANIATITQLMKCTSENLAHSLLNSSELSNNIKSDMVYQVKSVQNDDVSFAERFSNFNHSTDIKVSEMRDILTNLSKHVEEDFSKAKQQLKELQLLSSRVFAAVFVCYLFMDAISYLKSYLTSVKFDNIYITSLLRRTANDRGIQVEVQDVKNGVNSTGFRITKSELFRCLVPILQITLYLLMTVVLIMLDHIVHYLVVTGGTWLLDIPSTDITIQVHFGIDFMSHVCELFSCQKSEVVKVNKTYSAVVGSDAAQCKARPNKLDAGVLNSLGLLFLCSYSLAFLEVYAQRLRRKVASSFFQQQEENRIKFLIEKILNKKSTASTEAETKSVEKVQENLEMESVTHVMS